MTLRVLVPSGVGLVLLLATFQGITTLTVMPWVVAGRSMEPALLAGDRVLVDRWTYRQRAPRTGEIVLVRAAGGAAWVKRVAARPGASPDELWVVGDNPSNSADSRQFGPLPRDAVRGRVFCRYWPPSRAGTVGR